MADVRWLTHEIADVESLGSCNVFQCGPNCMWREQPGPFVGDHSQINYRLRAINVDPCNGARILDNHCPL